MMRDEEKMFNLLIDIRRMIVDRQLMHEEISKKSGTSGKRTSGNRARECSSILQEMNRLMEKYL